MGHIGIFLGKASECLGFFLFFEWTNEINEWLRSLLEAQTSKQNKTWQLTISIRTNCLLLWLSAENEKRWNKDGKIIMFYIVFPLILFYLIPFNFILYFLFICLQLFPFWHKYCYLFEIKLCLFCFLDYDDDDDWLNYFFDGVGGDLIVIVFGN